MTPKSPYCNRIKIFLDGADRSTMVEMANNPAIKGFTTNPSLMKKSGVKDYPSFCKEILNHLQGKPVSFEVFADEAAEMRRQALEIASWETQGSKVYVKIPVINSEGKPTTALVHELSHKGVKLNVTAVYTLPQVWEISQALKGGAPSIISIFAGRIADSGRDPAPTIQSAVEMCLATDAGIELLWASTREAFNIVQAELLGCHIITAPGDLIKKIAGFNKGLEQLTLETVRIFKSDAEAAGFSL
jgi:transaldolase